MRDEISFLRSSIKEEREKREKEKERERSKVETDRAQRRFSFPPDLLSSVPSSQQRIYTIGANVLDLSRVPLSSYPSLIHLTGEVLAQPNPPILSKGSSLTFVPLSAASSSSSFSSVSSHSAPTVDYRLVSLDWRIDYAGVNVGETVESDICLVIMASHKRISVSSGEEVLCNHESYKGGSPLLTEDKRIRIDYPGIPFTPGNTLHLNSVSNIFNTAAGDPSQFDRLASNPLFLRTFFNATLLLSSSHLFPPSRAEGMMSVRSPQRDRSAVMSPYNLYTPYTKYTPSPLPSSSVSPSSFQTDSANSYTHVQGLSLFLSSLSVGVDCSLTLEVSVNDRIIRTVPLPNHWAHETDQTLPDIIHMNLTLAVGDVFAAKVKAITKEIFMYDDAVYILHSGIPLVPTDEISLFTGKGDDPCVDTGGDGLCEDWELDAHGTLWSDRSRGGHHDTQHEAVRFLCKPNEFRGAELIGGMGEEKPLAKLYCNDYWMYLFFHQGWHYYLSFRNEYDDPSALPSLSPLPPKSIENEIFRVYAYGDYNGDGYLDRARYAALDQVVYLSLNEGGKEKGAGGSGKTEIPWLSLPDREIKRMYSEIWDGRHCLVVHWRSNKETGETTGMYCWGYS